MCGNAPRKRGDDEQGRASEGAKNFPKGCPNVPVSCADLVGAVHRLVRLKQFE
jgi:hypothetical protein